MILGNLLGPLLAFGILPAGVGLVLGNRRVVDRNLAVARAAEVVERLERESQVVDLLMTLPAGLVLGDLHPLTQSLRGIVGQHNDHADRNWRNRLTQQMLPNPETAANRVIEEIRRPRDQPTRLHQDADAVAWQVDWLVRRPLI